MKLSEIRKQIDVHRTEREAERQAEAEIAEAERVACRDEARKCRVVESLRRKREDKLDREMERERARQKREVERDAKKRIEARPRSKRIRALLKDPDFVQPTNDEARFWWFVRSTRE